MLVSQRHQNGDLSTTTYLKLLFIEAKNSFTILLPFTHVVVILARIQVEANSSMIGQQVWRSLLRLNTVGNHTAKCKKNNKDDADHADLRS